MSGRGKRRYLRNMLRINFGDRCYWCDGVMEFPKKGSMADDIEELATIEHYLQKLKKSTLVIHMRLAHKRCNR